MIQLDQDEFPVAYTLDPSLMETTVMRVSDGPNSGEMYRVRVGSLHAFLLSPPGSMPHGLNPSYGMVNTYRVIHGEDRLVWESSENIQA
jgi:hypothetical protein